MAGWFLRMTSRRHNLLQTGLHNLFSLPAVVSFMAVVLLTTHPSSAKRLPLDEVVKITESTPTDLPVLYHQNIVKGHLPTESTLVDDAERLLTLLLAGQPELQTKRFLYEVREGDRGPHLNVRAPGSIGKEESELQFSLKEYKVIKKPYRKVVILDSHNTIADQIHSAFRDPDKLVNDGNAADAESEGNSDLDYPDQEMAESTPIGEQDHSRDKRSLRLPRSPVTSRGFLGLYSDPYQFGVDEGQGQRPFHVPVGYDGSQSSVNTLVVNNHHQYLQAGQWNIHTPQNIHTTAFSEALYPLQQSTLLQSRNGRRNILPQTPVGQSILFQNGEHDRSAIGSEYNKKTFHENFRNYISQANVSQKKTLQNKKRDLSREHVTVGENVNLGNPQKTTLYRSSALEESNRYDHLILENAIMRMLIREENWGKSDQTRFANQFGSVSQDGLISLPSQLSIPVAVSEQVLPILPVVEKSSEYDQMVRSVPPVEDVSRSVDEGALVFDSGDQQKFWLEGERGLLHDVFSRPGDQSGLSPAVEPHTGIRIFKRSVDTGVLRKGIVPILARRMQEGGDSHIAATLSKRSPLSTGYVAGIGADADHHGHHDHMTAAATSGALHHAHHHDTIPPAVILSSGHHHNSDATHHLVAKSETTVGGSAGGASSGRGPNQEDSGPGALLVLHPPQPLVAAHADDDTIHVIAAVPFAVAHHHELHHEADHLLSKSTTLTLAQHDSDPHVLAKTTTVTTVTQHDSAPLLLVHTPDAPVVLLHHPPASQSSTSTTTVHKPPVTHNLLRVPLGGFGVGVTFGGAGAGHGFYAAG